MGKGLTFQSTGITIAQFLNLQAVKTHNTKNLEKEMESLRENLWYDVAFWVYALPFVDLFRLYSHLLKDPTPNPTRPDS